MMWLICGPSSVGKSTFIESGEAAYFANVPSNTPTKFPVEFGTELFISNSDFFLHYNILRPCHFMSKATQNIGFLNQLKKYFSGDRSSTKWQYMRSWSYKIDTAWVNILNTKCAKKAIVLVSTKSIIVERAKQRQIIENLQLTHTNQKKYPVAFWLDLYQQIDLDDVYRIWFNELDQCGIDYICVDSSDSTYKLIDRKSLSTILQL